MESDDSDISQTDLDYMIQNGLRIKYTRKSAKRNDALVAEINSAQSADLINLRPLEPDEKEIGKDPFYTSGDDDEDYRPEVPSQGKRRVIVEKIKSAQSADFIRSPLESDEKEIEKEPFSTSGYEDEDKEQEVPPQRTSAVAENSAKKKETEKVMSKVKVHELREKGQPYVGYSKAGHKNDRKAREARQLKPTCTSDHCKKSKTFQCNTIGDEIRDTIFRQFWNDLNWKQKKSYVNALVDKIPTKRPKSGESRRKESFQYYLKVNGSNTRVCKKMFLNTFGLNETMVLGWLRMGGNCGIQPTTNDSKNKRKSRSFESLREFAASFIDQLPKLPSHYCRKTTDKLYLEYFFESKVAVYNEYKKYCETHKIMPCGYSVFRQILKKKKVALYSPKKDQCDTCTSHKVKNLSDEEYNNHIKEKNRAREEKQKDKEDAIEGKCIVLTMDLQAVKIVPFLYASALYYKRKLCTHNFTVFNLADASCVCYWFTEVETDLTASTFVSCIDDYLTKNCLSPQKLNIILYSDGCTYQNRNCILGNFLSSFAMKHGVTIIQKFLVKGHTQMECDSVHSTIERKLKGKEIYLPSDYIKITREARKEPAPYQAELCAFSFFKDYTENLRYSSIRPGNKTNDPTVTDLRQLTFYSNGKIYFKLSFDDDEALLPQRCLHSKLNNPKARSARCKVSKSKYNDLQDLKVVLPADVHSYYDNLPV